MSTLFSIYVWLVWSLILLLLGPVAIVATMISRQLGFSAVRLLARLAFFAAGIRVVVRGAEKVDWSRSYVFMGNHQSYLDPFVFVLAIRQHVVGIEKKENMQVPVYGALARAWGNIPIDRANPGAARATIDAAAERFKAGTSIAILPEGTRSETGAIAPFKKGGFHLALNTGATIVPMTFNGVYERFRPRDWHIYPGTAEIVFDAPIETTGYSKETMDALIATVRETIASNFKGVALPERT